MSASTTWPPAITKAWFCFEALRRLGFSADDIRVGAVVARVGLTVTKMVVARVELRTQDKVYWVDAAPWDGPIETFNELWVRFTTKINGDAADQFTDAELQRLWDQHIGEMPIAELPLALIARGIEIPMLGEIRSPGPSWVGLRSVDQALEQHSGLIAQMTAQMIEQKISAPDHLGLIVEHDHPGFNKLRNLMGVARDQAHGVLVLLVGREYGRTKLAAHGISVPMELLGAADSAGALALVVCGPEGHGFGHAIVTIETKPN